MASRVRMVLYHQGLYSSGAGAMERLRRQVKAYFPDQRIKKRETVKDCIALWNVLKNGGVVTRFDSLTIWREPRGGKRKSICRKQVMSRVRGAGQIGPQPRAPRNNRQRRPQVRWNAEGRVAPRAVFNGIAGVAQQLEQAGVAPVQQGLGVVNAWAVLGQQIVPVAQQQPARLGDDLHLDMALDLLNNR